jgi:methionine-rich copper-binding protein CopC
VREDDRRRTGSWLGHESFSIPMRQDLVDSFSKGAGLRIVRSLVLAFLLVAQAALAQIQLVASNPQMGAVIHRHDTMFLLRFNKRVDNTQCVVSLQTPTGEQRALSLQGQTASDQIESSGTSLASGSYLLNWRIKTTGGTMMSGTVSFSVR